MKTRLLLLGALLGLGAAVSGCAEEKAESKTYKYEFTFNNCPTGSHSFSSLSDMCQALQNETLNQGCAQDMRRQYFEQQCPGTFTPF